MYIEFVRIAKEVEMKHAFVICAYKESMYLEDCIKSIVNQSVKTDVAICTSTPNKMISSLAEKYNIKLFVRNGESDIQEDWNYGCDVLDVDWVTVAHQDDLYDEHYAERTLEALQKSDDGIIAFTDYRPIHDSVVSNDRNCKIRRFLRTPMKIKALSKNKFAKKYFLSLGNAICCPSVTYNRRKINGDIFTSSLKFSLDWDTYVKLSQLDGRYIYIDEPLTYYRIHKDATTTHFVESNLRESEDWYMFRQFWPPFICKILMTFYKKAYSNYIFD